MQGKRGVYMIRRFISYYKPHRRLFMLDMIAAFIIAICNLFYPIITRNIINDYIPNKQLELLIVFAGVLFFIYILKMLLSYFVQYYGHLVGVYMQADMRRQMFRHLQKLPFSYYDEHETGSIMSRMIHDLMDISELAHHGPEDIFISTVMMVGSFVYLCTINWQLTCIIFVFIPFLILYAMKTRKRMSEAFMKSRVKTGEINANLETSIAGIRVSKAFTNASYEEKKFQKGNRSFIQARDEAYKAMGYYFSGTGFIIDLLNVVVLVAGGIYTYQGIINYGDFVAYLLFINLFIDPIKKLINFTEQLQSGMTGFQRFCEMIDEHIEEEHENAKELRNVKGDIVFEGVSYQYKEGKEVLQDVNLHVKEGSKLALVGPSGGGKTTICHLIPNFYSVTKGKILIDGHDIRELSLTSLRKNIGIVQQDVFLFSGTIKENIAYGNLEASEEEIIEAAKKANIHEDILHMKDGYDTQIGERGVKLSGGQKQRLSIARVFLKNPAILILDEATSALDNATEIYIQDALDELCKGRTTIVVAHRLSTIRNADEIVVIMNGRIHEQGTHDTLLSHEGIYKNLYESQFKKAVE